MNYNINDTTRKQLVELEISNRQEMLPLFDKVIEVLAKFDGKLFSKRIETALKKDVSENIRVEIKYNSFYIEYYFNKCYVQCGVPNDINYTPCEYIKTLYDNFLFGNNIFDKNELINYSQLKEQVLKAKEYIQDTISEMQKALSNVENTLKEYKELQAKCKNFNNSVNWYISKYYNIKRFDC